jgi:hypothetical protein
MENFSPNFISDNDEFSCGFPSHQSSGRRVQVVSQPEPKETSQLKQGGRVVSKWNFQMTF